MEPNDAASSSARAHELRASLGTRREVEALLAEASATREAAVADADAIIEEAQQVSDQLLRESRAEAERLTTDARLRAEGVVSRARTEAEDITRQARAAADAVRARAEAQVEEHRKRVRAELTEQVTREVAEQSRRELARMHERQQAMIGDLEASVRILGVSMEAATANIGEMLGSLDSLRAHTAESLGEGATTGAATTAPSAPTTTPTPAAAAPARHTEPIDHLIRSTALSDDDAAGGIFHNPAPDTGVPASRAVYDPDDELDVDELGPAARDDDPLEDRDGESEPPRTATEAFLRSAHLDHGDPPLPPLDDADVGARYARDAMRATARAKSRRGDESGAADTGDAPAQHDDASGKPLGWLFRSS